MERVIHTPEGVRDIYNGECEQKRKLEKRLHKVMRSYGYKDIETPTFEFFDVFSREIGTTPSKDLYKFFDREGNTLVLRPDFTPSVARAVAMYFMEETKPIRLCYSGSTFINSSSYQGRLKEATEMGVEFVGDPSADSDAEILSLIVDLLCTAGLKKFQVSLGEVEFFKSFLEEADMCPEDIKILRSLISDKNNFGVEEFVDTRKLPEHLKNAFLKLPQLFGGPEILEEAKSLAVNERAKNAIERLERIYEILAVYGCEKYIAFDLGMVSKLNYYTGIIFQAFTYGTGQPIIKGGRYDQLLKHFGKPSPSIGFAMPMENLMNALSRQNITMEVYDDIETITYNGDTYKDAIQRAKELRRDGKNVKLMREDIL